MLRFIDPDNTTTFTHEGVTFAIGFWPPREAERIGGAIKAVRALDPESDEGRAKSIDLHMAMVEWGVRGWTGWDAFPAKDHVQTERIHGQDHTRLSTKAVRALYLNNAIWPVGLAALRWNNLSEEEKKTSG